MSAPPQKLLPVRKVAFLLLIVFGWACYGLYQEHTTKGLTSVSIIATAVTLVVAVLIIVGMTWYANRPEPKDQ